MAAVRELVRREFTVDVPLQRAWDHLANVEAWTTWAGHIKHVTLDPAGPLTDHSIGSFRLAGGIRSKFHMEDYEPPTRWQWVGRFHTVDDRYDPRFAPIDEGHTRFVWTVTADGPGEGSLGRVFGAIYARNLDKAIPNLQRELHSTSG
jgi:hypothetical protein